MGNNFSADVNILLNTISAVDVPYSYFVLSIIINEIIVIIFYHQDNRSDLEKVNIAQRCLCVCDIKYTGSWSDIRGNISLQSYLLFSSIISVVKHKNHVVSCLSQGLKTIYTIKNVYITSVALYNKVLFVRIG